MTEASTGRTFTAPLSPRSFGLEDLQPIRIRNHPGVQLFTAAGVAVDAEKTVGEDAALEESAELALDESRQGTVAHAGQEALQFHLDDAIENGLLRAMALVGGGDRIVAGRRGEALHAPRVVRVECPYVEGTRRSASATTRDDASSEV